MDPILGEGILLRTPAATDRARWLELCRDPDQLRYGVPSVVPVPEDLDDVDDRIAEARQKLAAGQATTFVIADDDEPDRFLGTAGWAFHVPPALEVADVGYAVHPDARGSGVATRALRILTRWLTTDPGGPRVARVQLDHSVENPASCRTALAAGFVTEGVRRRYLPLRDPSAPEGSRRHDVCLHGFLVEP